MAKLIDPKTKQWTGEDTVLVQAGDGSILIMSFIHTCFCGCQVLKYLCCAASV